MDFQDELRDALFSASVQNIDFMFSNKLGLLGVVEECYAGVSAISGLSMLDFWYQKLSLLLGHGRVHIWSKI